jgi:hypothetical protein
VAKLVGRWSAKLAGRWVAKLLAHLLATAALRVRIQTSPKNQKIGVISKGVTNTLQTAKKYKKSVLGSVFRHLSVAVLVWISYPEPFSILGRNKRYT